MSEAVNETLVADLTSKVLAVSRAFKCAADANLRGEAKVVYVIDLTATDEKTKEPVHGSHSAPVVFDGLLCEPWTQRKACEASDTALRHMSLGRDRVLTANGLVYTAAPDGTSAPKTILLTRGLAAWDATALVLHSPYVGDATLEIRLEFCAKTKALLWAELSHTPSAQRGLYDYMLSTAHAQALARLTRMPYLIGPAVGTDPAQQATNPQFWTL